MMGRRLLLCALAAFLAGVASAAEGPAQWQSRVEPPGDPARLVAPRPFKATYRLAWGGVKAARAEVDCTLPPGDAEIRTTLKTSTIGLARSLWQMDATHVAVATRAGERPLRIDETDTREDKATVSRIDFTPEGATRQARTTPPNPAKNKPRHFAYANLLDMHTALLRLQSVPLANGESHVTLVMTVTNPYLTTLQVLGRETIDTPVGLRPAIRCSLELRKVGKNGELQPQKRFKSARVWVSDDASRTFLKAEVKVFVGTITMELESLSFS